MDKYLRYGITLSGKNKRGADLRFPQFREVTHNICFRHTCGKPMEYVAHSYTCPGDTGFSKPDVRVNADKRTQFFHTKLPEIKMPSCINDTLVHKNSMAQVLPVFNVKRGNFFGGFL
jgi:hypothetical protein